MTSNPPSARAVLKELDIPALFGSNGNESAWALFMRLTGEELLPGEEVPGSSPGDIRERMREELIPIHLERNSLGVEARTAKNAITCALNPKNPNSPIFSAQPDFVITKSEDTQRFGPGHGFAYLANLRSPDWHRLWRTGASPQAPMEWEMQIQSVMWAASQQGSNLQWALILPQIGLDPAQAPILIKKDEEICKKAGEAITSFLRRIEKGGPEPAPNWHADEAAYLALAKRRGLGREPGALSPEDRAHFEQACTELSQAREEQAEIYAKLRSVQGRVHGCEEAIASLIRQYGTEGGIEAGEFSASIMEERAGEGTYRPAPGKPAPIRRHLAIRRNRDLDLDS